MPDHPSAKRVHKRRDGTGFHFILDVNERLHPLEAQSTALMDISTGGCGLYAAAGRTVGSRCAVVFWQAGRFESRLATVAHSAVEPNGWTRIGLKFEPAIKALEAEYVRFVTERFGFGDIVRKAG